MLGPQGPGPGRQQHPDDSDCPHGQLLVGKSDPQNRGFGRKTRYPFALSLETLKVLEVQDGTIVTLYRTNTEKRPSDQAQPGTDSLKGLQREIEVLPGVGGRQLAADSGMALRDHRMAEPRDKQPLIEQQLAHLNGLA